jgi:hypothetical protein
VRSTPDGLSIRGCGDPSGPGYRDEDPRDGVDDARMRHLQALAVRFAPLLVRNTPLFPMLRTEQRGRVKGRNDCWKAKDSSTFFTASWQVTGVRACVEGSYGIRISELQATWRLAPSRGPIFLACQGNPADEVVATLFETDPPAARLERGRQDSDGVAGSRGRRLEVRGTGRGALDEGQRGDGHLARHHSDLRRAATKIEDALARARRKVMIGMARTVGRRISVASMLGVAVMLAAPVVEAQRWGHEDFPRTGACFFQDPGFRGNYFCAQPGRDFSFLASGFDNEISSIRTFGDVEVTVFRDSQFRGRSAEFRDDVRNLRNEGWNDRLSSLRVRSRSRGDGHGYGDERHGYRNGGHHGRYEGNPDTVVRRAYKDILEREPDAAGLRTYRSRIIDDGWSEEQVRETLRKSPEYRQKNTMTREKAEGIVRQAYRSVLSREPDAGSRSYVDKVMHDHWKQADVERELRKSPEYRNKHR